MFFHSPRARPQSTGDRNASAVIDGEWKLIESHESDGKELYQLTRDPGETTNLAQEQPEKTAELAALLKQLKQEAGAKQGGNNPFDQRGKTQ